MEILAVENLNFSYPESDAAALEGIDFSVNEGEFIVLCGESGCGKTTLLRLLKRELAPYGKKSGVIRFCGKNADEQTDADAAANIAYVMQNPEAQTVTDKVWHEISFGMENLGFPRDKIRLRAGETAAYFGIDSWFRGEIATLSGGQKQILALASAMVLSPKLLLLDEPTSQLDPIAAANFISAVYKLNRDLGMTVIMAEHRLGEIFPYADRVAVMEKGRIAAFDTPREICKILGGHPISAGFPAAAQIYAALGKYANENGGKCPLTVKEGKNFLSSLDISRENKLSVPECPPSDGEIAVETKNLWLRYEKNSPDILRGTNLCVRRGEIFSILGGNGAGKTTLLRALSRTAKPYRGKIAIFGENIKKISDAALHRHCVALLPQNTDSLFICKTVMADFLEICRAMGYDKATSDAKIADICEKLGISSLLQKHPYDISGGEMQKCAIAKIMLTDPRIILMDEPTKGIDAFAKKSLGNILFEMKKAGVTVIAVTHDTEFAAAVSDRCALFFDGEILAPSSPREFFKSNDFYTTAASRISRGIFENAVTVNDVVFLAKEALAK